MRKDFLFIMFLIWMGFLAGCRASKESKARIERTAESEIGVELRRVDSLWSSIAERLTMKIEFYPAESSLSGNLPIGSPEKPATGVCSQAASPRIVPDDIANPLLWQAQGVGVVGTGAACPAAQGTIGTIKSIEISAERSEDRSRIAATDSVLEQKTATTETLQEDKSLGARQDNGTVIGLAIVAAVAALVYFLMKQFLKR